MAGRPAVGVHDDLASGEAGVGVRAAELELPGGVGQDLVAVLGELAGTSGAITWSRRSGRSSVSRSIFGAVLGGDEDGLEADGAAVLVVEGDLGLAVGAQVRQHAGLAHLGQALRQPVGQPDRHRHQVVGLVAGVAEHHALVAGALSVEDVLSARAGPYLEGGVDALGDVGRLGADGDRDPAGLAVEADAPSWS